MGERHSERRQKAAPAEMFRLKDVPSLTPTHELGDDPSFAPPLTRDPAVERISSQLKILRSTQKGRLKVAVISDLLTAECLSEEDCRTSLGVGTRLRQGLISGGSSERREHTSLLGAPHPHPTRRPPRPPPRLQRAACLPLSGLILRRAMSSHQTPR